jgi:glycosyltransferase involved in cell wall biosynthesis
VGTRPLISVIITAYSQTDSLAILLRSLQVQELTDHFEVIICDDGSTPPLTTNIRSTLDLRVIWQSHTGNRAARSKNNGVRCATGRFLLFLDADIVVPKDFLRRHLDSHKQSREIVCNPRRWLLTKPSWLCSDYPMESAPSIESILADLRTSTVDVDRRYQRRDASSVNPWLACIGFSFSVERAPTVVFDEYFEGWGPEDRELAIRLSLLHGFTVKYVDDLEVYHLEFASTGRSHAVSERDDFMPSDHAAIVQFLRGIDYLVSKYPASSLGDLPLLVLDYHLEPSTDRWYRRLVPRLTSRANLYRIALNKCSAFALWLRSHQGQSSERGVCP